MRPRARVTPPKLARAPLAATSRRWLRGGCGCGGGDDATTTATGRRRQTPRGAAAAGDGDGAGGVRLQKLGDFEQPVYVTQPPGDRRDLFVVEQTGRVQVVRDGAPLPSRSSTSPTRCRAAASRACCRSPSRPTTAKSGLVYVDYTERAGDTRVVEYRRSPRIRSAADPASARVVLAVDQPVLQPQRRPGRSFGPDGALYVGLGDGGSEGDPDRHGPGPLDPARQDPAHRPAADGWEALHDPGDNPFVGPAGRAARDLLLRAAQPVAVLVRPRTGALAIGDVGQNEFEEVDLVRTRRGPGANFGWSAFEGVARFNDDQSAPGAIPPVLVYTHDEGCSVTGGYVVRDRSLPSLYGRYLYGDYCAGQLRSFRPCPGRQAIDDRPLGLKVPSLSSFGTTTRATSTRPRSTGPSTGWCRAAELGLSRSRIATLARVRRPGA